MGFLLAYTIIYLIIFNANLKSTINALKCIDINHEIAL